MRRRELMLLLGGALTAPGALRAQQKAMPVIGYLGGTSPESNPFMAAFRSGRNRQSGRHARCKSQRYR